MTTIEGTTESAAGSTRETGTDGALESGRPPERQRSYAELTVGDDPVWLFRDGAQSYPEMIAAIDSAERSVCLETYTFDADDTGWRFAKALCARAKAGVEVSVLYDSWGSSTSEDLLDTLHDAGVRTFAFYPMRITGRLGKVFHRLRRRNHRKVLVVDSKVAFTGGMNIADVYAGPDWGGDHWRDTAVRLEGQVVRALETLFLRSWLKVGGAPPSPDRYESPLARHGKSHHPHLRSLARRLIHERSASKTHDGEGIDGHLIEVVANDFHQDRRFMKQAYIRALGKARERAYLTSAYFVPTRKIIRALRKAAERGVDVRVIAAGTSDVRATVYGGRALHGPLLRSGVRIYEWYGRVLHAKTAVIDGHWSTVGSTNLDTLSLSANLELNVVLRDDGFGQAMERMFKEDLEHCKEVTLDAWRARAWSERLLCWLALQMRRWL